MKRFVFRLQTVLELRGRAERQAQIRLAEAQQQVAAADQALARLADEQSQTLSLPPAAPFEDRVAARAWADALSAQAARVEQARQAHLAQMTIRQHELAGRASERRAVEKLRERDLAAHQQEMLRQEQIGLDEIGSARHQFARRQGENR